MIREGQGEDMKKTISETRKDRKRSAGYRLKKEVKGEERRGQTGSGSDYSRVYV